MSSPPIRLRPIVALAVSLMTAILLSACAALRAPVVPRAAGSTPAKPPVYLHYYLWWTAQHWHDKLGTSYPYGTSPPVVPGTLGWNDCHATVGFPGASIVDVPSEGLSDQSDPVTFDRHIAAAAGAGVRGFVVSWQGTGASAQAPSSSGYDARLDLLVHRVDAYNATHTTPFSLALGLSAYGSYARPSSTLVNDLTYFVDRYGNDRAFVNDFSPHPLVMLLDSRKYNGTQVHDVATRIGSRVLLVSDDTNSTWPGEQQYFSGASWYWSSQNPYTNPQSGAQLRSLAAQVHAAHKLWFAPFAPGFDAQLNGGKACTPRNGSQTLASIWNLNRGSRPDAWFGISWNEFVENTYLEPSRARGTAALDTLSQLIASQ